MWLQWGAVSRRGILCSVGDGDDFVGFVAPERVASPRSEMFGYRSEIIVPEGYSVSHSGILCSVGQGHAFVGCLAPERVAPPSEMSR